MVYVAQQMVYAAKKMVYAAKKLVYGANKGTMWQASLEQQLEETRRALRRVEEEGGEGKLHVQVHNRACTLHVLPSSFHSVTLHSSREEEGCEGKMQVQCCLTPPPSLRGCASRPPLFTMYSSLFPLHYSRFTVQASRFTIHVSRVGASRRRVARARSTSRCIAHRVT